MKNKLNHHTNLFVLLKNLNIMTNHFHYYVEALTHNSYDNEHKVGYTYQRLEFLGDSIINKLISVFLYQQANLDEQKMTEIRKVLVNTEILKQATEDLNLLEYAFVGNGIDIEKDTHKIKADLFEALIGAVYLDQGEKKAWEILKNTVIKYYYNNQVPLQIDYKTKVQELFQNNIAHKHKKAHFYYQTIQLPNKMFQATLIFGEIVYGKGTGKTKKEAQKNAAKEAYEKYAFI